MLKSVKLGEKILEIPIIQGGMGVGISLSNLAGNVMKQGAMGVISAAHPGYRKANFRKDSIQANCEAILEEVNKARVLSQGKGLLGINIMVASKDYAQYVKAAVQAKVDAIISGAGLPLELPTLVGDAKVLLAPIVSSGKAMKLIAKMWDRRHEATPDFVVIEGSEAGGHLGFKKEDLVDGTCQTLDEILIEVQNELAPYREKYQKEIPVFVAGGVYDGADIAHYIQKGANGVQMGTRFIATEECDASPAFKQAVLDATKENIAIVPSPTGFPGRGLWNDFMETTKARGNVCMKNCLECMIPCTPSDTPYCISEALIQSAQGKLNNGLVFVGSNAWRITQMTTVEKLIHELVQQAESALEEKE